LPEGDAERPRLERQAESLAKGRKAAWKAELPKLKGVVWGDFERGFVGSAVIRSAFMYHQQINRLVHAVPLERVGLKVAEHLKAIGNSRHSKRLRYLDLDNLHLSEEALSGLVPSANLDRLEVLDLSGNVFGDDGARYLAHANPLPPRLKFLDLSRNSISDASVPIFVKSNALIPVGTINLSGNRFTNQGKSDLRAAFGERVIL
jgi:Ran GTPase-activating protein (RanGAP) involved in mRNA processing and transport